MFINNLFDGSSESFSNAVKLLDNKQSFTDAKTDLIKMSTDNTWDLEDESVSEFLTYVNRRYV